MSVVAYWSAQAISCLLLLTTDARVQSQDTPRGNVRAQSDTGIGLTPEYLGFPRQYHSAELSNLQRR